MSHAEEKHPQYAKNGICLFFFSPQGHLVLFRWLLQRVQISQTPILSSGMLPKHLTSASTSCAGDRWVPHEPPYPVDAFRVPEMQGSLKLQAFTCRVLTVSFSFQWNPIFASRKLLFHSKTRYFVCGGGFFFFGCLEEVLTWFQQPSVANSLSLCWQG